MFVWGPSEQAAFSKLRQELYTAPMLHHPRSDCEFILDTDASNFASGGVLSQVVDGVERVLAFASVALNNAQMNYCTTHRELLAVVIMTTRFRHYLLGRRFTLRTDHGSLRWLTQYKDIDGMLARWLTKLQEYDMNIVHRPGTQHGNADGLSRCHKCKNPECQGALNAETAEDSMSDTDYTPFDLVRDKKGSPEKENSMEFIKTHEKNETRASMLLSEKNLNSQSVNNAKQQASRKRVLTNSMEVGKSNENSKRRRRVIPRSYPDTGLEYLPNLGSRSLSIQTPKVLHTSVQAIEKSLDKLSWLGGYTTKQIKTAQRNDSALSPIITSLEQGQCPDKPRRFTFNEETQALACRWNQLRLLDGLLYRRAPSSDNQIIMQLILPAKLRAEVLHQLHDLRVVGHLGVQRTLARVQQRFYWPGCSLDVARWCAACPECAGRKGKPGAGRVPMSTLPVGAPFDRVALDILDTHKVTPRGNRYILVISVTRL